MTKLGFISDLMIGVAGILFHDTAGVFHLLCGSVAHQGGAGVGGPSLSSPLPFVLQEKSF